MTSMIIDASAVVHRLFSLGLDTVEIATALGISEPLVIDCLDEDPGLRSQTAISIPATDDPPRQEACP